MEIQKTYNLGRVTGQYHVSHHTNVLLRILPGVDGRWIVQTTTEGVSVVQECVQKAASLAGLQSVESDGDRIVMTCSMPREDVRSLIEDIICRYDQLLNGRLNSEFGDSETMDGVPF